MKRSTILLLALCAVLVAPLAYFSFTPLAIDGVSVTPRASCDDDFDTETHTSSRWQDGMLVVDVSEAQTCGESQQTLAVQRLGGTLFIRTTYESPTGEVAACHCRHSFSVGIPGVPRREYAIAVYNLP